MRSIIFLSSWVLFCFPLVLLGCWVQKVNTALFPPSPHNYLLINKQQKYRSYQHHSVPMSSNEAKIIHFFLKEGKTYTIFYSSASVTTVSSSICNSAFEWRLTSHGGWPSSWLGKERRERSTQTQNCEWQTQGNKAVITQSGPVKQRELPAAQS